MSVARHGSYSVTAHVCRAFQHSPTSTFFILSSAPWHPGKASLFSVLHKQLRDLRVKWPDWSCPLAEVEERELAPGPRPTQSLGFFPLHHIWSFPIRFHFLSGFWDLSSIYLLVPDPCLFWFSWKDPAFPDRKIQQELLFLRCPTSDLSRLTFPSSIPEARLTQRTLEPPAEAWSKTDWQTPFGIHLLKIES